MSVGPSVKCACVGRRRASTHFFNSRAVLGVSCHEGKVCINTNHNRSMKYRDTQFIITPIDRALRFANPGIVSEKEWIPLYNTSRGLCTEPSRKFFFELPLPSGWLQAGPQRGSIRNPSFKSEFGIRNSELASEWALNACFPPSDFRFTPSVASLVSAFNVGTSKV